MKIFPQVRSFLFWGLVMLLSVNVVAAGPTLDLPYKPGPLTSEPETKPKAPVRQKDPVRAAVPLTVVDVAIPFIPSKSPDPVGAPDP